ncbi:hypothetical protein ETB97_000297 [Aspergillus alliaceus]|uniref:Uncharacterized protein n=1 Tax=Petromyces alliaceus TaxID=209559 RepID=A0A8H6A8S4_PETAA|nr:hypothetical protein ETB97_000297 [Aspergillus burnettii]
MLHNSFVPSGLSRASISSKERLTALTRILCHSEDSLSNCYIFCCLVASVAAVPKDYDNNRSKRLPPRLAIAQLTIPEQILRSTTKIIKNTNGHAKTDSSSTLEKRGSWVTPFRRCSDNNGCHPQGWCYYQWRCDMHCWIHDDRPLVFACHNGLCAKKPRKLMVRGGDGDEVPNASDFSLERLDNDELAIETMNE